nr:hypothetical protein [uncultured Rhodopila sp.]
MLIRHVCDLRMMLGLVETAGAAALALDIATADAAVFRNQCPACAADIPGETRKALGTLQTGRAYRARYDRFVADIAHGERPGFSAAIRRVADLAVTAWAIGRHW